MRTAAGSLTVPWRKFLGEAKASGIMGHAWLAVRPMCGSGELAACHDLARLLARHRIAAIGSTNLPLTATFPLI